MKKSTLILLLFYAYFTIAQTKMISSFGHVSFEASVPLFEEIKAKNDSATCLLNKNNGEIMSVAIIKNFRFKIALMEKHFNENYLESDAYSSAVFKGVIEGFNWNIIGESTKEFILKGILKIHGKSKKITTIAQLRKVNGRLEIISDFNVNPKDFNIKIPKILQMKIAETVTVSTHFILE